jgi:hypothetical protein
MTSDRKAEANRRNALKSTGPKTPEGKTNVRLNAMRHGLLSKEVLLPGEDEEAFRELGEHLRDELQPVGELENLLVDRAVAAVWRLRRLGRVEAGIFVWERYGELAERAERYVRDLEEVLTNTTPRPNPNLYNSIGYEKARDKAHRMRSEQEDETATLGRTFARDADKANAFSKLSRYETAIERQLYKALHELERRQAARQGGSVQLPQIVDVDVSGIPEGGDG